VRSSITELGRAGRAGVSHAVCPRLGFQGAGVPEGPAQAAGTGCGAGHGQPFDVGLARLLRVDHDVAVAVLGGRGADADALVPALHARDRIGLHREGEVLVDAVVVPPDPLGVRVALGPRFVGVHTVLAGELPARAVALDARL